jgi:hypothetical protein
MLDFFFHFSYLIPPMQDLSKLVLPLTEPIRVGFCLQQDPIALGLGAKQDPIALGLAAQQHPIVLGHALNTTQNNFWSSYLARPNNFGPGLSRTHSGSPARPKFVGSTSSARSNDLRFVSRATPKDIGSGYTTKPDSRNH